MYGICSGTYHGIKRRHQHFAGGKLMLVALTGLFVRVKRPAKCAVNQRVNHVVSHVISVHTTTPMEMTMTMTMTTMKRMRMKKR